MRERLLAAFLSLTLLTVLLYGVPRAFVRAGIVTDEARADVQRSADVVAAVLALRAESGGDVRREVRAFVPTEDQVVLRRENAVQVLAGPVALPRGEVVVATAAAPGGGQIEVRRPRAVVRQDVLRALRPIVLTGLIALSVAALAGVLLAGRLARPFSRLAEQATRLGAGDFETDLPPQRVREAESIAAALRASSARLTEMLARERDFARNASHQLRTPLTGMRIRVEDVSTWPETPPVVRQELEAVLAEVDRLSDTVTSLLSYAREGGTGRREAAGVGTAVERTVGRWRPIAAARGREVVAGERPAVQLLLPRVAVEQVLDVLVDNALKHGRGRVSVSAAVDATSVRFLVADEGEVPVDATGSLLHRRSAGSATGEGIGLSLSSDLVTALGGRLHLLHARPTTFEVALPATSSP